MSAVFSFAPCPHERRPGTAVCLHCRHEEYLASQARRRRTITRFLIGLAGLSAVSSVGVLGATALMGARRVPSAVTKDKYTITPAGEAVSGSVRAAKHVAKPLQPIIAPGTTALDSGVIAVRSDSDVTLLFDTPMIRTRIPEKFERFVRATLPALYGREVDSLLQRIPQGALASQGDLLNELPQRGVRIMSNGWRLVVYPGTRPGQDGPLVIRARIVTR